MKLIYLIVFILQTGCVFSQDITGVWIKGQNDTAALEFLADGTFKLTNPSDRSEVILKRVNITYKLTSDKGENYIEYMYYVDGKLVKEEKTKYRFKDDKLYLPRTIEINGITTIEEYADVYTKLE